MSDVDLIDQESSSINGETKPAGGPRPPKPAKTLPTDRIRFDKQLDILRAFAAASGHERTAVTNKDVGAIVGMAESTIAQITPFFVDTGLLVRAGDKKSDARGFIPSNEATSYQKAHEWDRGNAAKKLAPVLLGTWFVDTLTPKLKFRAVNEREAIHDLGEVAAVGPDKEVSLRTVIDYMVAAGLVERDAAGMLRVGAATPAEPPPPSNKVQDSTFVPPPQPPKLSANVSEHQVWLLEILNAYPDLPDEQQDAILQLIKTIKKEAKKNAPPAANE